MLVSALLLSFSLTLLSSRNFYPLYDTWVFAFTWCTLCKERIAYLQYSLCVSPERVYRKSFVTSERLIKFPLSAQCVCSESNVYRINVADEI
jgi:hypothetical protein